MAAKHLGVALLAAFGSACSDHQPERLPASASAIAAASQQAAERTAQAERGLKTRMLGTTSQVFFYGGIGIVYDTPLKIAPSIVKEDFKCVLANPDTSECKTEQAFPYASNPLFETNGKARYIIAYNGAVCPDKKSAAKSLKSKTLPEACTLLQPDSFPAIEPYIELQQKLKDAAGQKPSPAAALWAYRNMP